MYMYMFMYMYMDTYLEPSGWEGRQHPLEPRLGAPSPCRREAEATSAESPPSGPIQKCKLYLLGTKVYEHYLLWALWIPEI